MWLTPRMERVAAGLQARWNWEEVAMKVLIQRPKMSIELQKDGIWLHIETLDKTRKASFHLDRVFQVGEAINSIGQQWLEEYAGTVLEAYAAKQGIPREAAGPTEKEWRAYILDYSVSHGPQIKG